MEVKAQGSPGSVWAAPLHGPLQLQSVRLAHQARVQGKAGCLGLRCWIRGHRWRGLGPPGPTLELVRPLWPLADPDTAGQSRGGPGWEAVSVALEAPLSSPLFTAHVSQ